MKAHYPSEFMAAIMTRRRSDIKEITKLMDECKSINISTLGPDVNESYLEFGANKKGEIRFGLAAIKGMGDSAAQAIIDERDKNGPYKSIFDFAERVNLSSVNRKAFESLVYSGGFDSFGIKREQYFEKDNKDVLFIDKLLRYGQLYQAGKAQTQNSLFGETDSVAISTPAIPEAESWNLMYKLNKERDLVGIYLSAHPLDEFGIVLNHFCNTHCNELEDKEKLIEKEELKLGGIVTGVKERVMKNGLTCGFVTIEDFEGSGEMPFFGEEWGRWKGMFAVGNIVYVNAKCYKRYNTSKYIDFNASNIRFMQTVKEQLKIDKITIMADKEDINDTIVSDLSTMIDGNPGDTQVFFQLKDTLHNQIVTLRSKDKYVKLSDEFVTFLDDCKELSYAID